MVPIGFWPLRGNGLTELMLNSVMFQYDLVVLVKGDGEVPGRYARTNDLVFSLHEDNRDDTPLTQHCSKHTVSAIESL